MIVIDLFGDEENELREQEENEKKELLEKERRAYEESYFRRKQTDLQLEIVID